MNEVERGLEGLEGFRLNYLNLSKPLSTFLNQSFQKNPGRCVANRFALTRGGISY